MCVTVNWNEIQQRFYVIIFLVIYNIVQQTSELWAAHILMYGSVLFCSEINISTQCQSMTTIDAANLKTEFTLYHCYLKYCTILFYSTGVQRVIS